MGDINYIKVLFAVVTLLLGSIAILINNLQNFLPLYIKQSFSYGKSAYKAEDTAPIQQIQIPKSWFKHFYVYASFISSFALYLMILTLIFDVTLHPLVLDTLETIGGTTRKVNVSGVSALLAMSLFTLHCYRRLYETNFISVFGNNGHMNLWHYLLGFAHYTGVVLAILIETPKFTRSTTKETVLHRMDVTNIDIAASLLFLWASWHQHKTAIILANLRKDKKGFTITQSHKLPQGGWFDYVSSPHFLAEILIYFALNIILRNNTTWMYVFLWVLCNQTEGALLNHWWYQTKFEHMPKQRKAIIPFIY